MFRKGNVGIAAFKGILNLGRGELMKHHLHHSELVKVGVQKAGNDRHRIMGEN
jgi:hypothetical protein